MDEIEGWNPKFVITVVFFIIVGVLAWGQRGDSGSASACESAPYSAACDASLERQNSIPYQPELR